MDYGSQVCKNQSSFQLPSDLFFQKKFYAVRALRSKLAEISKGISASKFLRVSRIFTKSQLLNSSSSSWGNSLKTLVEFVILEVPGLPVKSVLIPTHDCLNMCCIIFNLSNAVIGWLVYCFGTTGTLLKLVKYLIELTWFVSIRGLIFIDLIKGHFVNFFATVQPSYTCLDYPKLVS